MGKKVIKELKHPMAMLYVGYLQGLSASIKDGGRALSLLDAEQLDKAGNEMYAMYLEMNEVVATTTVEPRGS